MSTIFKHSALWEFRFQLIKTIILQYGNEKWISIGRPTIDSPLHLSARYIRSLVSWTAFKAAAQGICYVHSHTKKDDKAVEYTRYQWEECDGGLCIIDCLKAYHTLEHFW